MLSNMLTLPFSQLSVRFTFKCLVSILINLKCYYIVTTSLWILFSFFIFYRGWLGSVVNENLRCWSRYAPRQLTSVIIYSALLLQLRCCDDGKVFGHFVQHRIFILSIFCRDCSPVSGVENILVFFSSKWKNRRGWNQLHILDCLVRHVSFVLFSVYLLFYVLVHVQQNTHAPEKPCSEHCWM